MMKLQFDQVLDYVRSGEVDPMIREMLGRDPDGPDMLREARLMCEALREDPDSLPEIAGLVFERPASSMAQTEEDTASADEVDGLVGDGAPELPRKKLASFEKLVFRATSPMRSLGMLRVVHWDDQIRFSYVTETIQTTSGQKQGPSGAKYESVTAGFGVDPEARANVVISGLGLMLTVPESVSPEDSLQIRVENKRLQIPARFLEITFMPEHGAFTHTRTDNRGSVEMPIPEISGTLRFETEPPVVVGVQVKK